LNSPRPNNGLGLCFITLKRRPLWLRREKGKKAAKKKKKGGQQERKRKRKSLKKPARKGGQEKGKAENGQEDRAETSCSDGGIDEYGVFNGAAAPEGARTA